MKVDNARELSMGPDGVLADITRPNKELQTCWQHIEWKESTEKALARKIASLNREIVEQFLYLDGGSRDGATWAITVLNRYGDNQVTAVGYAGGQVQTDRTSDNFVGLLKATSMSAEPSAVIWGVLVVLQ